MKESTLLILPAGQNALLAKPLSKNEYRVLWWLAKNLSSAGGVVTQQAIAEGCGLIAPNTSRVLNQLLRDGFIRRIGKVGTAYHYRLNTHWFGFI